MLNRDTHIITKTPPEHYSNSKSKNKKIGEKIRYLNDYEKAIIVFDDILSTTNSRYVYQLVMKGRLNNLDFYYLSQSVFDLSKKLYEIMVTTSTSLIKH